METNTNPTARRSVTIAAVLADHQATWDSWGWSCPCGERGDLVDRRNRMETAAQVAEHSRAMYARAAMLEHQGKVIDAALD